MKIQKNERSWAIEMISLINQFVKQKDLKIKSAGGETTISYSGKRMFPDIILYANDEEQLSSILQGWEIKMPDVPITNEDFVQDAQRKALALGLNSCIIWNFTYVKFYILNKESGIFDEAKQWNNLNIKSREDVETYKSEWEKTLKDVLLEVNKYLLEDKIIQTSLSNVISNGAINLLINSNKTSVANYYHSKSIKDAVFEAFIDRWWKEIRDEYKFDETDKYAAYSKSVILNWAYKIIFAHLIKGQQQSAVLINELDYKVTPEEANLLFDKITEKCDFFNVFKRIEYNDVLPTETWESLIELSLFLKENGINEINQNLLQQILEGSVNTNRRELNGQFVTPKVLARILVRITIHDWSSYVIDPCCGTGTIPHEIVKQKKRKKISIPDVVKTTWASDKYTVPLQIANLSMLSYDTINLPNRLFQQDALKLAVGEEISFINPKDGSKIKENLPEFGAICSNLPFVSSNNIQKDELNLLKHNFSLDGKSDLCYYIALSLSNILKTNGYLGIITPNAWLGTKAGDTFFNELRKVYNIRQVHVSGYGKWFKNADVVTTILLLQKKDDSIQEDNNHVSFFIWKKGLSDIENNPEYEDSIVNSSLLDSVNEHDSSVIKRVEYSYEEIERLHGMNLSYNALFHNVRWLLEKCIKDKLIPITTKFNIIRGSRRGWDDLFFPKKSNIEKKFLKPALFNAKGVKTLIAEPDREAFVCNEDLDILADSYPNAYQSINKFSRLKNKVGKPLPQVLKMPNCKWYEMKPNEVVDFFTMMNPDDRLFFGRFENPTFINQRLIGLTPVDSGEDLDLQHALLNSLLMKFFIEAVGFGRGLGVLDINKDNISKCFMLNSSLLSDDKKEQIKTAFKPLLDKDIESVESEMKDEEWVTFNHIVLQAFGIDKYYARICESLSSLRRARKTVKVNDEPA
jgi:hypothetical protein